MSTCQHNMYPNELVGARLREERQRLGLSQAQLAERGGIQKQAQLRYEKGERAPGADYLVAIEQAGADLLYVLTGRRDASVLPPDEEMLLAGYRSLDANGRAGVLGMISGMKQQANARVATGRKVKQNFDNATVGQRVKGDITAPFTINMGTGKPKKKTGG